jgi:hypothetical protein
MTRITPAIVALVAMTGCFSLVPALRADVQSEQDATSILTTGQWCFGGRKIARTFNADGTFTSSNGSKGRWKLEADMDIIEIWLGTQRHWYLLPIDPTGTRGFDAQMKQESLYRVGSKADAANQTAANDEGEAAEETPSTSPDAQQSAAQIIQTYHNSLVFVTGTEGSGSGFIATIGNANYLVTNVHVTAALRDAAFKTLDGTVVQGGTPSMAVGEDIFCMAMPSGGKPFEVMEGVDSNAAVGDDVVVLGNAEGAGVVNTIMGKIVGIGPNLVEINAPFVPGNSGSPIVHLKTGKVIGVATYLVTNQYDLTTNQKLKQPVVRRFGYRLDSVKAWQPVNWRAFDAQATEMESIDTLTDDLYDFFRDMNENHGIVTRGRHNNPAIKDRIDDWLNEKSHSPSEEDAAEADANFVSFLKIVCQSDVTAAQGWITYDYFRRDLADQKQTRDEMTKAFQQIIRNLGE